MSPSLLRRDQIKNNPIVNDLHLGGCLFKVFIMSSLATELANLETIRGIKANSIITSVLNEFGIYNPELPTALLEKLRNVYRFEPVTKEGS